MLCGLRLVYADGAHLGGDARLKMQQGRAGGLPIKLRAQPGQLFEQRVDGRSQSAREQTALMAGIELGGAGSNSGDG